MKKITLALVAFMLVLGMTQCKKEQQNNIIPDEGETVYITMKVADDGGKHIVYPGTGAVVYSDGDVIYVGNNGHYVGQLTYANGAFSGTITSPSTSDYLHFYFTGGKTPATNPTTSTTSFTVNIADQRSKLPVLSYGHSTSKYIDGTTAYTCMLENKCGLVKFVPSESTTNPITVSGMKTTATIDFSKTTPGITPTDATGAVTLYSVSGSEKWAILLPQNEVVYPNANNTDGFWNIVSIPAVTANMYHNAGIAMTFSAGPFGAINSLFTINANGDKVYFSKGNLQYQASTKTWRFAENQYDLINSDNYNISSTYTGWIDLFGWGTSGYNHGAVCYQPWSTSTTSSDYCAYGGVTNNLYDGTGLADWGCNTISNGGNGWRTLKQEEWTYILSERTDEIRFAMATVNAKSGVILFPDGITATQLQTYGITITSPNSASTAYNANNFSATFQLEILNNIGAVFLPVAGYRNGTSILGSNQTIAGIPKYYYGCYWSASSSYNDYAKSLRINDNTNYNSPSCKIDNNRRDRGFSVRLVKDKQ